MALGCTHTIRLLRQVYVHIYSIFMDLSGVQYVYPLSLQTAESVVVMLHYLPIFVMGGGGGGGVEGHI